MASGVKLEAPTEFSGEVTFVNPVNFKDDVTIETFDGTLQDTLDSKLTLSNTEVQMSLDQLEEVLWSSTNWVVYWPRLFYHFSRWNTDYGIWTASRLHVPDTSRRLQATCRPN
jgi:hypothetical protein